MKFSHLDDAGKMCMVDISAKPRVYRSARAAGRIIMQPETIQQIQESLIKKGDALAAARLAGIQAAKQCSNLIPLCHAIRIDYVSVDFSFAAGGTHIDIEARATCVESTGIEMEVLTAVSVAALTLYDMCKAVDSSISIEGIRLLEKTKRKSFTIASLNVSAKKGEKKTSVDKVELRAGVGIVGDAHALGVHRQVSLLAEEDIDLMRGRGMEIRFGDFAENITTRGVALSLLPIGTRLYLGDAVLEITHIGKECHNSGCAIKKTIGECVMPSRGVFARVLTGGEVDRASPCSYDI